jgi:hypothetical protein
MGDYIPVWSLDYIPPSVDNPTLQWLPLQAVWENMPPPPSLVRFDMFFLDDWENDKDAIKHHEFRDWVRVTKGFDVAKTTYLEVLVELVVIQFASRLDFVEAKMLYR